MKWKTESNKLHYGKKRIVKDFALFPYQIGEDVRWLETVYIRQSVGEDVMGRYQWYNREFVTREEYEAQDE